MFCAIPPSITAVPTPFSKSTGGGPDWLAKAFSTCAIVLLPMIGKNSAWCSWSPVFSKRTWLTPAFRPLNSKPYVLSFVSVPESVAVTVAATFGSAASEASPVTVNSPLAPSASLPFSPSSSPPSSSQMT
jgi:hypothetical protein